MAERPDDRNAILLQKLTKAEYKTIPGFPSPKGSSVSEYENLMGRMRDLLSLSPGSRYFIEYLLYEIGEVSRIGRSLDIGQPMSTDRLVICALQLPASTTGIYTPEGAKKSEDLLLPSFLRGSHKLQETIRNAQARFSAWDPSFVGIPFEKPSPHGFIDFANRADRYRFIQGWIYEYMSLYNTTPLIPRRGVFRGGHSPTTSISLN